MTKFDARLDIDPTAQVFADVIVLGIQEASRIVQADGKVLTLNALMGALCSVMVWHIAGIADVRARRALMRQIEKDLPRLVAQNMANGKSGLVETIYQGGKTN